MSDARWSETPARVDESSDTSLPMNARHARQDDAWEHLFEALFSAASDAVLVLGEDGHYLRANRRAAELLGYSEDELRGLRPADLLSENVRAEDLARDAAAIQAGQAVVARYEMRRKDGCIVPVEVSAWRVDWSGTAYLGIVRDLSEHALAEAARRSAAEVAETLARPEPHIGAAELPAYFAVAVSHELRTPLTTVLGSADALLRSWARLDNAARHKGVERILSGARRLDLLVRDLLLVTGLEEGELVVRPRSMALIPILEQAIYDVSAAHPNLDVRARGWRAAPTVWADPDRVQQIVEHLLDNAASHGQGAGPPEVRVERHVSEVEVRVSDRGPGLPREGRERLFTRFGKLSSDSHAGRVGTGLGLYICRRLVEQMGGSIGVVSTRGKGASFWFTLPLAAEAPDQLATEEPRP